MYMLSCMHPIPFWCNSLFISLALCFADRVYILSHIPVSAIRDTFWGTWSTSCSEGHGVPAVLRDMEYQLFWGTWSTSCSEGHGVPRHRPRLLADPIAGRMVRVRERGITEISKGPSCLNPRVLVLLLCFFAHIYWMELFPAALVNADGG